MKMHHNKVRASHNGDGFVDENAINNSDGAERSKTVYLIAINLGAL
jgi:hypothetical protein